MKVQFLRLLFLSALSFAVVGCSDRPRSTVGDPTAPPDASDAVARTIPVDVVAGDDWRVLSERFFGDASRALLIASDNGFALDEPPAEGDRVVVRVRQRDLERVRLVAEARGPYNQGVDAMRTDGQLEVARKAFERALKKAPFFTDARYNLGLVHLQLGEPQEAQKLLEPVVAQRAADKDARYAMAASYFHEGDYPRAIGELEAALALDPSFLRARWTYALALQRSGRTRAARQAWTEYLELDDRSSWADQARTHLREMGS